MKNTTYRFLPLKNNYKRFSLLNGDVSKTKKSRGSGPVKYGRLDSWFDKIESRLENESIPWNQARKNLHYGKDETESRVKHTEHPDQPVGMIHYYLESEDRILAIFTNTVTKENKRNRRKRNLKENIAKATRHYSEYSDKDFQAVGFLYNDPVGSSFELFTHEDLVYEP